MNKPDLRDYHHQSKRLIDELYSDFDAYIDNLIDRHEFQIHRLQVAICELEHEIGELEKN